MPTKPSVTPAKPSLKSELLKPVRRTRNERIGQTVTKQRQFVTELAKPKRPPVPHLNIQESKQENTA